MFHRRNFPSLKPPWICKHLSEILVPASGLHGRGRRKSVDVCLPHGIGARERLEYHINQRMEVTARLSSWEGCHFTLTSLLPVEREGAGKEEEFPWGGRHQNPYLWVKKWPYETPHLLTSYV